MGRGKHKDRSHSAKRKAYNSRRQSPNYPRGGYGEAKKPYLSIERHSK
jgi:hypothetical protein